MKKLGLMTFLSYGVVCGSSHEVPQEFYDADDGIHDPNSTRISYSVQQKAIRDTGNAYPNAQELNEAYDALAQKPGTLVYQYEQEKSSSENK